MKKFQNGFGRNFLKCKKKGKNNGHFKGKHNRYIIKYSGGKYECWKRKRGQKSNISNSTQKQGFWSSLFGSIKKDISSISNQVKEKDRQATERNREIERRRAQLRNIEEEERRREIGRQTASRELALRDMRIRQRQEEERRRQNFLNNPLGIKRKKGFDSI